MDYNNLSFSQIMTESDANGKRLVSFYVRDYRALMGADPCLQCGKAQGSYVNFLRKYNDMKKAQNSGFELKQMYCGIPVPGEKFGSKKMVSNVNLTDDLALKVIKNHPKGTELFKRLPKDFDIETFGKETEKSARQIELEEMKAEDVKVEAERLEIDTKGKKADLIKKILKKEQELSA